MENLNDPAFLDTLTPKQREWVNQKIRYYHYLNHPIDWVNERSPFTPTNYQKNILQQAADTTNPINQLAIRACRGAGKTFITAMIIAWFIDVHETLATEWAVQTTAPSQRVLTNALWREINKSIQHLKTRTDPTITPLKLRLEGRHGVAVSQTVTPGSEVNLEGMHAPRMLVVLDEAKGVRDAVFHSLRGSFSEAGVGDNRATVIAISTPGPKHGTFYQIHANPEKHPDWKAIHVTQTQALQADRISQYAIDQAKQALGEKSARYQNDWLGEFATDETESWTPPNWLTQSRQRWNQLNTNHQLHDNGPMTVGLDPARHGQDKTVLTVYNPRQNAITQIIEEPYTENVMDLIPRALNLGNHIVLDADGLGSTLYDAFRKHLETIQTQNKTLLEFRGGTTTTWKDQLGNPAANTRSAAYTNLYQNLQTTNTQQLALPPSEQLDAELNAQRFITTSAAGKIRVDSKDNVKKRLGRSPDIADATMMSIWQPPLTGHQALPVISVQDILNSQQWQ